MALKTGEDYRESIRDGRAVWDGVENALARKHLRSLGASIGEVAYIRHGP